MQKKYCQFLPLFLGLFLLAAQHSLAQTKPLSTGTKAPTFSAEASLAGKDFNFSLQKALAKGPVVLYFYPAAYTGGCDLEAHTFSKYINKFDAAGATIIGVSADSIKRLNRFSSDPDYCAGNFPVASDPKGKVAATYGLKIIPPQPGATDVNGDTIKHGFIPRTTFVLDKSGKVAAVFSTKSDHISPDEHVTKSLEIVKKLQSNN
jgi:peroxiredoxin